MRWDPIVLEGRDVWLCDPCHRRWHTSRCHEHGIWRPYLAAEWLGLRLATTELWSTTLPAYCEREPDGRGTERRWQFLEEAV
jgi:hypothetical protein